MLLVGFHWIGFGKGKLFAGDVGSMDIRSPSGVAVSIRAIPLGESGMGVGTLEKETELPGFGCHALQSGIRKKEVGHP